MSPALLRRYRAERMLRRDFEELRGRVLDNVRARLRAQRVTLDADDLEECYLTAWHGLYTVLLAGETIDNPCGWLTVVCYRRAIDEHRSRTRETRALHDADGSIGSAGHVDLDLAGALDDRTRLRETFEALRAGLSERERQAATLCYLQGLTRAQAAAQMGISEKRMRKLMEGRSVERPGVAAKVEELLQTVRSGGWCEQQESLMRALAFGMLDPDGVRYRIAEVHRRECPACRAYVLSLRGLSVVLPPLMLPLGPFAAGVGSSLGSGAAVPAGSGTASGGTSGGAMASGTAGGGAVGGAVGGGGTTLAGSSLAAKLAAGCLLAAGVGGGCAALLAGTGRKTHLHTAAAAPIGDRVARSGRINAVILARAGTPAAVTPNARHHPAHTRGLTPSSKPATYGQAQRELTFERRTSTPIGHATVISPAQRELGFER